MMVARLLCFFITSIWDCPACFLSGSFSTWIARRKPGALCSAFFIPTSGLYSKSFRRWLGCFVYASGHSLKEGRKAIFCPPPKVGVQVFGGVGRGVQEEIRVLDIYRFYPSEVRTGKLVNLFPPSFLWACC